ncbi:MAG: PepSY domain-containing protein [Paraglaciecola sp.]|nr:PepSY domain-containing protein [Paraglaciecola sp.]
MKKETLKNLTDSHGWIGVIISGLLFVIFLAGSISLFRDEIFQWTVAPTHAVKEGETLAISQIMELAIRDLPFNAKEHLTVLTPDDQMPYYRVYVDLLELHDGHDYIGLLIEPTTGEIIGEIPQFFLAEFIYELHESLALPSPYGSYLIGFVTMFFFFITISGVFIHARKLFKNFFRYRTDSKKRSQWLGMHNVIGTISLPFTVMYAMTGLIFNLVIIYQITFAVALYQGDQQALLKDAGFRTLEPEWLDKPLKMNNIDELINQFATELGHPPKLVRMYNYGDQSAIAHFRGKATTSFPQYFETAIALNSQNVLFKDNIQNHNELRHGTDVLSELHFGSFAGLDLRIIYFLLGLAVCVLIVTGNLLWIEKRQKNRNGSQRSVMVMTKLTLASTLGVVIACCAAFLAERILPVSWEQRSQFMIYAFLIALLASSVATLVPKKQTLLVGGLFLSCAILVTTILCDWLLFSENLMALWATKNMTVFAVQIGILLVALLFAICAYSVHCRKPFKQLDATLNQA